jgi:hypothetical protein
MRHKAYRLMVMGEQCSVHQICRSGIPNVYGCKFPTTLTKFHTYASQSWAFNSILFWVQSSLSFSSPFEKLKELLITTLIVFQFWSSWIMLCILDIFGDLCCEMLNLWQIHVRACWSSQRSHGDGGPMLWMVTWQWKFQVTKSWS